MESGGKTYYGLCVSDGLTAPATPGMEFHGALSQTEPLFQFNLFECAEWLYDKIERW